MRKRNREEHTGYAGRALLTLGLAWVLAGAYSMARNSQVFTPHI